MKQLVQRLLFVFAVLLPMAVWSQETVSIQGGIKYTLEEGSWVVTGFDQTAITESGTGFIEILPNFDDDQQVNHQVTKIRANAFEGISGVTCLRMHADFETVEDLAFAGLGTEGAPMRLEMDFYRLLKLDFSVANGVCQLAGGYFEYMYFDGSPGFTITYKLTKKPERNGEDMIPGEFWLTNVEQDQGADSYYLRIRDEWDFGYNIGNLKLAGIVDNALDGVGSNEAPMTLEMNVFNLKQFGGTYADGIVSLKGGIFQLKRFEDDNGIRVTYAYNEDAQNNREYIITKVEKIPDWGDEGFTDYQLVIYTQQDWVMNPQTGEGEYVPVTTFKANAITDEAKGLIKSVYIYGTELTTVEADAFTGLGTAEAPLPFQGSSPVVLATTLGGTYTNGVLNLQGGLFVISKTDNYSGIRVTYAYSKSNEGKDEYVVTKVEKSPYDWDDDYQLRIQTQQDREWNTETQQYDYIPVTTFKANVITDEAKGLIKSVFIDGTDLTTVEENAFAGLGTSEAPLPFQGSSPVALATALGGTYNNGVLNLQGGLFVISKTDNYSGIRVTYAYSKSSEGKDEYVVSKVEKSPYDWDEDYQLRINTQQDGEWNAETQQLDYIPVTTFKANAIAAEAKGLIKSVYIDGTDLTTVEADAFAGLGSAENPLPFQGSSPVALAKTLGGTFTNGVLNIGGGLFVISKTDDDSGIRVTYAYSKSSEGKDVYVVSKVEKSPENWWGEGFTDYQLRIYTQQDEERNPQTDEWEYIPVTTFKANVITDEAKGLIKSVFIDGTDLTTVEENAFSGLGTAEAPLPFQGSSPVALAKTLGGTFTNGVLNIGGGLFVISKTDDNNGIRVTYAYSKSNEGKEEYVVSKVEKSPDWGEGFTDYQMFIRTQLDGARNPQTDEWEYIPVTTFKANVITDEAKGLIKSVFIDGTDLTTVEENAFAGLGTAEAPLPFQGSSPVVLATTLGGTYTNGVLNLQGGLFVISKTDDEYGIRVTYAYSKSNEGKDEYVVSKVEKSPKNWWGVGFTDYQMFIRTQLDEDRNPQTGEWEYIPVTTFKANAITEEAKALIKSVYIDGTDLTTVEENAFAGLGTAESPLPLQGYSPVGLAKSLNPTFTVGVASIGGGFFAISRQNGLINYLVDGEEYIAASYDQAQVAELLANNQPVELNIRNSFDERDAEGHYKSYSVTKIKAGAFNGIQGVTKVTIDGNNLVSIGENAFGGIGADQPINLAMPVQTFKKLGGRFANGQGQLAGGLFVMARQSDDYRVAVTYAYNEDGEGNSEYIVTKIEESQKDWWDESDPYRLTISGSWGDGRDEITGQTIYTPVTTISATALDPTLATKISMVSIYDNNLRTIENNAFAGIGTVDNPAMLEISSTLLASLNPTTEGGATLLQGGYFRTAKAYWAGNGFQDAIYYSDGDGFMLTEPIVAYPGNEEYNLVLTSMFYDYDVATETDLYYPVTHMAKSAFDGIRNLNINSVTIDGENLQMTLDADAFEGFGAQTPIDLSISINLFEKLGGTITDGVATLAGGRFKLVQIIDNYGLRTYYTYQKPVDGDGEYVVSNVEKLPYYGYDNYRIVIESDFFGTPVTTINAGAVSAEVKALALKSVEIYGKTLKSVDENEFDGIGTSESPVNLTIQPEVFSALGGSVENGLVKLAGGYFMTDAVAKVTAAPVAAEGLEFNNEPQALLTAAGEAENGVMYYYVEQTQQTSDELPMATNAGTYTIGYYAKGINGYLDSEWYHIQVTIAPKVRENAGSTEVEQISPTQFNVTIDETGGTTPTPIDNDLLDADGGITVYDLSFIRDLNATGEPYTLCLPCTPPTEDAVYYTLTNVVNDNELVFEEVAKPLADTPYLVVPTSNTSLNKNLNNVRLLKDCGNSQSVGNFTMKGTQTGLDNAEAVAEGAYILQSGNVWKRVTTGSVCIPAFRAYIVASGAAPARLTSSVGDATAIDTIHTIDQDGTERWYDMNGRRIAQPVKKGVYINNNKKVIKK